MENQFAEKAWQTGPKWPNEPMEPLFELEITRAPKGSREIASHLFQQLRLAILDGRLTPGSRLPSTRAAPDVFGASRNTVQDVYDRLAQEGMVESRHGSGTYVRDARPTLRSPALPDAGSVKGRVNLIWERPEIDAWIGFWHESDQPSNLAPIIADLRPALVDQRLFPHAIFRQVMARELRKLETVRPRSKSPQGNQGNGQLRRAIAEHVSLTRAVACEQDDVLVTSGAQQGFDLLARTLVTSDETIVAVEDPGYPPMRVPFALAGARIAPIRVDAEGIVVDEIQRSAKIICVCPSHQFPLGMPTSPRRRHALLRFAEQTGAVIVEDDYDGEFRHDANPIEALRSQESAGQVCYVGSFSKCMFPSLRLGFLVPPRWARSALVAAKNATDWHCSVPVQTAVARFILDGHLARHIRRVRRIYRDRRNLVLDLLDQHLGRFMTVVPSFYGMHIAAVAKDKIDCEAISHALAGRGILIHSLHRYFIGPPTQSGFVIAYAAADGNELRLAVEALADEVEKSVRRSG